MSATRTPEQIRSSVEANRRELGSSLMRLKTEWRAATDWRGKLRVKTAEATAAGRAQLRANQQNAQLGAAAAGFVLSGGLGGVFGLFRRR